jgi:hypothetical protein
VAAGGARPGSSKNTNVDIRLNKSHSSELPSGFELQARTNAHTYTVVREMHRAVH